MDPNFPETINRLRDYIQSLDGLPSDSREQLLDTLAEVERTGPESGDGHAAPLGRLKESMLELEARHPDATMMVKSLADILGRMGL